MDYNSYLWKIKLSKSIKYHMKEQLILSFTFKSIIYI